jgi:hypothetical protein
LAADFDSFVKVFEIICKTTLLYERILLVFINDVVGVLVEVMIRLLS